MTLEAPPITQGFFLHIGGTPIVIDAHPVRTVLRAREIKAEAHTLDLFSLFSEEPPPLDARRALALSPNDSAESPVLIVGDELNLAPLDLAALLPFPPWFEDVPRRTGIRGLLIHEDGRHWLLLDPASLIHHREMRTEQ